MMAEFPSLAELMALAVGAGESATGALDRVCRSATGELALAVPNVFCGHWHQRRIHELAHPDGSITRIDVLNKENSREGNAVLVWQGEAPIRIEPLLVRG